MKRLDKLEANIEIIKETLVRNTSSLDEHIRRTEILEHKIEPLERTHAIIKFLAPLVLALPAVIYYLTKVISHGP